jgi:hypothetical protein
VNGARPLMSPRPASDVVLMPLAKRLLAPLVLLLAFLAVPSVASAATIGVSDQQASAFTNPLFAPLKFRAARYIAPYDAMSSPVDHLLLDAWLRNARARGLRVLVAFEHSRRRGRERRLPSVAEYTRSIKAFKRAYPWVPEISVWNEVNRCVSRRGPVAGQPTCGKEKRLAQYYSAARRVFRGKTIVALDVLDGVNITSTLRVIRRFMAYARPRPRILGFHNYSDTNRFSALRTRRVLAAWRGDVWLTETGGIVKLGSSFPFNTRRAAKALGCMFTLAKQNRRIKRLYVYQFHGAARTARFDAGLVDATGLRKRPGYDVVRKRAARRCAK